MKTGLRLCESFDRAAAVVLTCDTVDLGQPYLRVVACLELDGLD